VGPQEEGRRPSLPLSVLSVRELPKAHDAMKNPIDDRETKGSEWRDFLFSYLPPRSSASRLDLWAREG